MKAILLIASIVATSCVSPYPNSTPKPKDIIITKSNNYYTLASSIKEYENQLSTHSSSLQSQKYAASDIAFLGTVVSVIAAASGALTTALYSGGVGVGGSMVSQRYNYDVQISNYRAAIMKLNCMYRSMLQLPADELKWMEEDTTGIPMQILQPYVSSVISDIHFELDKKQSEVELTAPDLTSLAGLIDNYNKARKDVLNGKTRGMVVASGEVPKPDDAALLALTEAIRANIGICKITSNSEPHQS